MQAMKTHVAGVDVHKEILGITVLIGAADQEPREEQFECSTFTDDLRACGIKLKEMGVTDVAMESTGVYCTSSNRPTLTKETDWSRQSLA